MRESVDLMALMGLRPVVVVEEEHPTEAEGRETGNVSGNTRSATRRRREGVGREEPLDRIARIRASTNRLRAIANRGRSRASLGAIGGDTTEERDDLGSAALAGKSAADLLCGTVSAAAKKIWNVLAALLYYGIGLVAGAVGAMAGSMAAPGEERRRRRSGTIARGELVVLENRIDELDSRQTSSHRGVVATITTLNRRANLDRLAFGVLTGVVALLVLDRFGVDGAMFWLECLVVLVALALAAAAIMVGYELVRKNE